jgi:gamma-glutamyltranspeptidase/glutathione hydrolase
VQKLVEKNPNQKIEWLIDNERAPQEGEIMIVPELAE